MVPLLSVVFSFRDEAPVLEELVRRVRAALDEERKKGTISGHELIFVDDDSQDGSAALLMRLAGDRRDIKIVTMSRRFGISECALEGLARAKGGLVVYMDCDLQDPPEVIPELLAAWKNGKDVDVVHTVRASRDGDSLLRLALTQIGYRLIKAFASIDLPVEAGDFKLLTRRAVEHVVGLKEKRPYLRGLVCWIGLKSATVTYRRARRPAGRSKHPVLSWKVIGNFLESALISFSVLPLYGAGLAGALLAALGLAEGACLAAHRLNGVSIAGWKAAAAAVFFVGGLQLLALGVIGLYLGGVLLEVKGRPACIVKKTFGFEGDA